MRHLVVIVAVVLAGCGGAVDEADPIASAASALSGANGKVCAASAYDCKLRPKGGNRVLSGDPGAADSWAVVPGGVIRDGDGGSMGLETSRRLKFNFGQTRTFDGRLHAFAMTTSNRSAGWYPVDHVVRSGDFLARVGHVSAHGVGLEKMGCYEIRDAANGSLAALKVVYDARDTNERAGDYLPLQRADGRRSANLCFNVPGFGLGGAAVDHFATGTKFQRLRVPTSSGRPSVAVPLWARDASGRYRRRAGSLLFVYGYVVARTGTRRVGWMAYPALQVSSGCP